MWVFPVCVGVISGVATEHAESGLRDLGVCGVPWPPEPRQAVRSGKEVEMGHHAHDMSSCDAWAVFRLQVIGELLQHPPDMRGERRRRVQALAERTWTHPVTGAPLRLGYSTIARWYDVARRARDPVAALRRKPRCDRGTCRSVDGVFAEELAQVYAKHPQWTAQLLYDNVVAVMKGRLAAGDACGPLPGYASVRRYMRAHGMVRRCRRDQSGTIRAHAAERRFVERVVERYECSHVGALVHWDFHVGSCSVRDAACGLVQPRLLAFLDDRSRLVMHAQWYDAETTQVAVHGCMQAFATYGLPRAMLCDNGSAMRSAEMCEGLDRLGVAHRHTQVYSPYQNGKMECFWGQVEGRLLAMIGSGTVLDMAQLNRLTMAWLQEEYHVRAHAGTEMAPRDRWAAGPSVMRAGWRWEEMTLAFTRRVTRTVRRSVGSVSYGGVAFDLPPAYRHFERAVLRVKQWDRSRVWLCHPMSGEILVALAPIDPESRADGRRRRRAGPQADEKTAAGSEPAASSSSESDGDMPPLLLDLLRRHEAKSQVIGMLSAEQVPALPESSSSPSSPSTEIEQKGPTS